MGSLLGGGKKTDNAQKPTQNYSGAQSGQHGQSSGSGLMGSLGGMFGHQGQSVGGAILMVCDFKLTFGIAGWKLWIFKQQ
jgi:hypothetical protein